VTAWAGSAGSTSNVAGGRIELAAFLHLLYCEGTHEVLVRAIYGRSRIVIVSLKIAISLGAGQEKAPIILEEYSRFFGLVGDRVMLKPFPVKVKVSFFHGEPITAVAKWSLRWQQHQRPPHGRARKTCRHTQ
jgi:hypothetical protein